MENKDFFEEKLVESAENVVDMKEVYNKKINDLSKLFKFSFGKKPAEFKHLVKMVFFKDGMPKETSKAKITKVLDDFIQVAKWYNFLGKGGEISRILNNHGISITFTSDVVEDTSKCNKTKFDNLWPNLFNAQSPGDKKELLQVLLDEAIETMTSIQTLKKEVEETNTSDVELKCKIDPAVFKKAVALKASALMNKDISEKINKIETQADQLSQIFEQFNV